MTSGPALACSGSARRRFSLVRQNKHPYYFPQLFAVKDLRRSAFSIDSTARPGKVGHGTLAILPSKMPIRIIVNADDLGMSAEVNEAIFRALEDGVITSATMLSNGSAVIPAARMLHRFPNCSFGVHLNLTDFQPLCAESYTALSSILDGHNCFNGNAIRKVRISAPMLRAIYREWCAQIDNLIEIGMQPSHLDAHHHVHTIPQMLPVLAGLH